MKKFIFPIAAFAVSVMLTGCTGDKKSGNADVSQTTTSQSVTTTVSQGDNTPMDNTGTGDIDGDGLLEELGTDVNDIVDDVVTGVEDVADDVLDMGR